MRERTLIPERITKYERWLRDAERSEGTIEKYLRDVRAFAAWTDGRHVTRELVIAWKEALAERGLTAVTINSMLAAVHGFFAFAGWKSCRVKYLKVQRKIFRDSRRELSRGEYRALVETAHTLRRERLALLIETIAATGIRVSEVKYLTVEAARAGQAEVALKGKIRVILLPGKLCRKLLRYAKKQKTASGAIFRTRNGNELSRKQIWSEMKAICGQAGVAVSKVFPHNLRHLFAAAFYRVHHDVVQLADILGHSSIETTRLYLLATGAEHRKALEKIKLLL